jgi:phage terminase large subunit-like protein
MTSTLLQSLERCRRDPVAFVTQCLVDPETGKPFVLYPQQVRFLREALTPDKNGRLRYRELVFSAPKKSGKTTLAAFVVLYVILCLAGAYGEAYIVANDEEQAIGRAFTAIARICQASPLLRHIVKITSNRIEFTPTNATITALASEYAGAAGTNPHIVVFDELWAYTSERARRLWDEMPISPARKVSVRLTVTYAGYTGESDLLEDLYRRGSAGEEIAPDLRAGKTMLQYWTHETHAPWQDAQWLEAMRESERPNTFRRMYENHWVSAESQFVSEAEWDACVDAELRPSLGDSGLGVFVGLDGSVRHDFTAMLAVSYDHDTRQVKIVNHKLFRPQGQDIDFSAVEAAILDWNRRFHVRRVHYDPHQLQALAQRMRTHGVNMVELNQTQANLTAATSNLLELIQGRNLTAYPSDEIKRAVLNAAVIESPRGFRLAKERTSAKIDLAAALSFACLAAVQGGAMEGQGLLDYYRGMAERAARGENPWVNPDPNYVDPMTARYEQTTKRLLGLADCAKCVRPLGSAKVWVNGKPRHRECVS